MHASASTDVVFAQWFSTSLQQAQCHVASMFTCRLLTMVHRFRLQPSCDGGQTHSIVNGRQKGGDGDVMESIVGESGVGQVQVSGIASICSKGHRVLSDGVCGCRLDEAGGQVD